PRGNGDLADRRHRARRDLPRGREADEGPGVKRLTDWLVAALVLLLGRRRRHAGLGRAAPDRVVAVGPRRPGSELLAIAALGAASLCAVGFVVVYAVDSLPAQTQLLGLSIGLCFAFVAAAF